MKTPLLVATAVAVILVSCQMATEGSAIGLPSPEFRGGPLEETIAKRRSIRSYSEDSLSIAELSQLLFAAQGVTGRRGDRLLRASPSAGGTYPIEVYVFANRVGGLEPGIYRYQAEGHEVRLLKSGFYGDRLADACLGQSMPGNAAVSLVLTAVLARTTGTYGSRGIRYIHMEAGHISQNICLQATSLGLGAVPIGAFDDSELDMLIGIDGEQEVSLYVNSIGKVERERGEID
jgi:SagB-type dehydrogenase family enzyme